MGLGCWTGFTRSAGWCVGVRGLAPGVPTGPEPGRELHWLPEGEGIGGEAQLVRAGLFVG